MLRGEQVPQSKLTEADIPEIRAALAAGTAARAIARRFGVSDRAIRRIRDGATWSHVP